jgi:UDP-N-acetylmuramoyl-tripeptide--D-alanyl-D-alanine ligase
MGELGEDARTEHEALGELLGQRRVDHVVVVGNGVNQSALESSAREHGVDVINVDNTDAAVNVLDMNIGRQDIVLVKASYADGLWRVAEGLLASSDEIEKNR